MKDEELRNYLIEDMLEYLDIKLSEMLDLTDRQRYMMYSKIESMLQINDEPDLHEDLT